MLENDLFLFNKLLLEVTQKLQEEHPEVGLEIRKWKGSEIDLLRDDLRDKVNGTISEKWFYTHIKKTQDKLPRHDTLNLLCVYIGQKSWQSFASKLESNKPKADSKKRAYLKYILAILGLIISIYFTSTYLAQKPIEYKFCFLDQNTHQPVVDSFLTVQIIKGNETPINAQLKGNCFEGKGDKIEFIVSGRYYKPLKIMRRITSVQYEESIFIVPDDYAMMLHFFTHSKIKDWKKRRKQLSEMIYSDFKAFEISAEGYTIDILNKKEFINKLTIPTKSLKQIEVIKTKYINDKISEIKFIQK